MIRLYLICLLFLSWENYLYSRENILIVREKGKDFQLVFDSIKDEIKEDFDIYEYTIGHHASYAHFVQNLLHKKIDLLVLMDNQAIDYGKRLKSHKNKKLAHIKAVALMGLNMNKSLNNESTITGVNYEVPPFTIITSFRRLSKKKIKKVLVFYRASESSEQVLRSKEVLEAEGINLELVNVEQTGKSFSNIILFLKRNLKSKIVDSKADAVLVLPDNVLLNQQSFLNVWIPTARSIKKPFLCGIDSLASVGINFCTFSASPDHAELGSQVSQMIYSIVEDNVSIENIQIEQIVSVEKTLNMKKMDWMKLGVDDTDLINVKVLK